MRVPKPVVARTTVATILAIVFGAPGNAQPCNPVIDGTYCASQTLNASSISKVSVTPMQPEGLGASLFSPPPGADEPGMLGTITFNSTGGLCLGGLLRGVRCN
jgi:hypothetical protein